MGAAASSLEGNSCEEQVRFWTLWHESTREKRHAIGIGISKEINRLMRSDEIRSAQDFKKKLAQHVKSILPPSRGRRRPRKRR
jgi:hypothetical protein